jgi:hypothetical protein
METLGCNIVDTYFHTSARTGPTGPNKPGFLLHERAAAPFLQENSWDQRDPLQRAILLSLRHCIWSIVHQCYLEMLMLKVKYWCSWLELWSGMMHNVLDDFRLCCVWVCGDLVHEKFGARYSGHLLSRLAVSAHNMTKQIPFPTTWREHRKSIQSKWV